MDTDTLPRLTRRVGPAALGAVPVLRRLVQALFPQAPLAATHTALPGARSPSESSRTTVAAAVARAIIELPDGTRSVLNCRVGGVLRVTQPRGLFCLPWPPQCQWL